MKIILFGSNGMLGNYFKHYLSESYEIISITRTQFDIETSAWDNLYDMLSNIMDKDDIIINCAGAIPQRNKDIRKYIILNTLFPIKINEFSNKLGYKFIHITTDCVFSGKDGDYAEHSKHDAEDIYGITKSLGEESTMCILRTSIIGEEVYNKNSLIEWVMRQKNGIIDGYSKFYWNGVTCLQLAKIIGDVITRNLYWEGIRHFYSPDTVSKYELCCFINEIYDLNIIVNMQDHPEKYMTLSSIYDNATFNIPTIKTQLYEQKNYYISSKTI
jgi:dTDP-4-dehydrorhamnose reductase